jgi:hypothetical protein
MLGVVAVGLAPACGGDPGNDGAGGTSSASLSRGDAGDGSGSPDTEAGDDATTTPGTTGTTAPPATDGDSDGDPPPPILFDLGVLPDAPASSMEGCAGIDFLFVVDNSGSMTVQQQQLLNSFSGFISAIQNTIDDVTSYHVGVLTSDAYTGNAPGCTTIGDLVTQTVMTPGCQSSMADCAPFAEGYRFATEQDDLEVKFPCMAQVGTCGSPIEQPVTATIAALDPAKAQPGGCNEGFLREDAILVVVIVTDDPPFTFDMDDAHPSTDTTGWYDAVIAAKGGDPEAVVVIGFVPWMDVSCNGAESPNLIGFVQSFGEQGVLASICSDDFGPVFAQTIETIETTCDSFVPSG